MNAARSWQVTGRLLDRGAACAAAPACSSCHTGALLQQLGHQARPAGLVASADAAPGLGMEVPVERPPVAPIRAGAQTRIPPEGRAPAIVVGEEDPAETPADVVGDLGQRPHAAGAGRALNGEPVAEVV